MKINVFKQSGDHMTREDTDSSRRNFIKKVGGAAAGLLVAPYLKSSGVFAYSLRQSPSFLTTVAICNTANTPADSYVYDDIGGGVRQKVKYLLDLLDQYQSGAVSALFSKGKKVAIKINLTGGSGNAGSSKLGGYTITEAMWTHPAVLQGVGQFIIDAGVNPTDLYIVDSFWDSTWQNPGSTVPFGPLDRFGYRAVQQALGCNVVDLSDTTAANIAAVSTGSSYYNFSSLTMNKLLQAVDVYVSIPKLKHHSAAGFTCALKNQVGIVPKSLYTITNDNGRRGALHHSIYTGAEWTYLPRTICDLNAARPVHLAVVDGIKNSTGGEGSWCANFVPCSKHALLAGLDPVATDSIGAKIMGLDPEAELFPLPAPMTDGTATSSTADNHLHLLNGKGVGTNQLGEIQPVGDGTNLVTSVRNAFTPLRPSEFQLCSNFPNPFNPSTMIVFYMPHDEFVSLTVYDITGRAVETLVEGQVPAGEHRLQWSADGLASGVYLCRMQTKGYSKTIKLVYQK
jgi:uncharacterized protein (DUF362 family)